MMYLGPVIGLVLAFLLCESSISSQIDSNSTQLIRRIAFGSCFNPNRGSNIWNLMRSHGPHQIILLGDQFYADREVNWMRRKPTLSLLKQEYELWTSSSEWHALASSVEDWISVYDDHDYGLNNGDRTFELRNESMKLFHQYNSKFDPFLPGTMVPKEGVFDSRVVHLANEGLDFTYKIVLVDVRSAKESQGPSRTLLGSQQWTWLEAELSPQALQGVDLVLVGSPIQILPDDKLIEERWSEFPDERQRLLELISSVHSQTNVLLLSGDIHSAEISRVKCSAASSAEFQIVELTSSGLSHSFLHRAIPNVSMGIICFLCYVG